MCGIAGILNRRVLLTENSTVKKMLNALSHRGPNAEGVFVKDNIALGHRRLSIIDLSIGANQPFSNSTNRYKLVFNGELYNFEQVKDKITNCNWRTTSDTEVLVEAWARWGINCIELFKGMFAFAVWDEEEKSLHIVRDRLGIKPLYYYNDDNCFAFASEIRALLASNLMPKKINQKALENYLAFQSIPAPISIIENIKQLEAGCYITIKDGQVTVKRYWDIVEQKNKNDYSNKSAIQKKIYTLLEQSVEQRLVSDVPVGAFLSGGIDSSAVVGLMARLRNSSPETFNISYEEKDYDESQYAELVAKKYNTNHHKILLKPTSILDELTNALDAMDTPSGDGINSYVVSKAVKKAGITVALSGIGGDELFAGYPFFHKYYKLNQRKSLWKNSYLLRKTASTFLNDGSKWKQLLQTKSAGINEIYPVLRQVILPKTIKKVIRNNEEALVEISKTLSNYNGSLSAFPSFSQVTIADLLGYTQNTLLKDADQMSMAVALEVREPFFDHELIEYILGIPDAIKYPTYPKQLLVESLGDLLPPEIVHRKKQGFVMPWNCWLRSELKDFCEAHIKSLSQREWFSKNEVMHLWENFKNGYKNIKWIEVWMLVVLDYWLQKNID